MFCFADGNWWHLNPYWVSPQLLLMYLSSSRLQLFKNTQDDKKRAVEEVQLIAPSYFLYLLDDLKEGVLNYYRTPICRVTYAH